MKSETGGPQNTWQETVWRGDEPRDITWKKCPSEGNGQI